MGASWAHAFPDPDFPVSAFTVRENNLRAFAFVSPDGISVVDNREGKPIARWVANGPDIEYDWPDAAYTTAVTLIKDLLGES